jgi:hypothetical protein
MTGQEGEGAIALIAQAGIAMKSSRPTVASEDDIHGTVFAWQKLAIVSIECR